MERLAPVGHAKGSKIGSYLTPSLMSKPTMTPSDFQRSLGNKSQPPGLSVALKALWWAGRDDWDKAHDLVMSGEGAECAWVHAYLHRVEGDIDNARYWYRQARRAAATGDLAAEWAAIAAALLGASGG